MQSLPRNMYQRDYSHSFNQEKCFLSNDIMDYWYVSQGKITVPSIDDREDMQFANEAFDVLGFTQEEKYNVSQIECIKMSTSKVEEDSKNIMSRCSRTQPA